MLLARRGDFAMLGTSVLLILVDQITKHWVTSYFATSQTAAPVKVIGSILELDFTPNSGVAFSLLEGQKVLFVFIALAIGAIGWLYWRLRESESIVLKMSFGLILGGAAGNLIDRFTLHYVVDFIHFHVPGVFDFAVFNVADSGITIGVILLAFLLWSGSIDSGHAKPQRPVVTAATEHVETTAKR